MPYLSALEMSIAHIVKCYTKCTVYFTSPYSNVVRLVKKGKERKSIYIAFLAKVVHSKRSGMDHAVLPANNTMPAFQS